MKSVSLTISLFFVPLVLSANILFLLPISSKSHKNVFDPLINALALRGHKITTISSVKSSSLPQNVTELVPIPTEEVFQNYANPFEDRASKIGRMLFAHTDHIIKMCHKVYQNEEVKMVLKSHKFDLVIVNGIGNQCFFGMIHDLKAPAIALLTLPASNFNTEKLGTHLPYSSVPLTFLDFAPPMTFRERVINLAFQWFIEILVVVYYTPLYTQFREKYHGKESPKINQIERNLSMLLVNSHFSMNPLLPLMPDIVEIGGMHCRPTQPLKDVELNKWLSGAEHGFIYFSFGSIIQGNQMPEKYRKLFITVFGKLKQRVLWKWETETMEDLPENVRLSKWLPQQDILGHPNIKMFMTHGGLLSTQESVYHGVPVIGFPFFADQDLNMAQAARQGFGIKLEILELTEEILEKAIQDILTNHRFKTRAKEISTVFRDQPETSLERAVYWTEYVIRHKGAVHLRSEPARSLNFFQYHSYDVCAFLLGSLFISLWISKIFLTLLFTKLFRRENVKGKKNKKD